MKCIVCQTETSGAFCPNCGAPVSGAPCSNCQTEITPGANYCTGCGTPVRKTTMRTPWIVAGASLIALVTILLAPGIRSGGASSPTMGPAVGAPAGSLPERAAPLTGTPREQADRLFNRIMLAREQGDIDQAAFFLPMGVLAYRQAGPLDHDGLYHLSLLETAAGEPAAGLETAERILREYPEHLLALGAAAQAAEALQDHSAARRYHERFLAVFQAERAKPLPEYLDHSSIFPAYREEAEAYLKR